MIIKEIRIVNQDWFETKFSKTGWDSHGWFFADDGSIMGNQWTIVEHLKSDKFGNPFLGVAEKVTTINQ